MAAVTVVTIEVIQSGQAAAAILACLDRRHEGLDQAGGRRFQISLLRAYGTYTAGVEEVETALERCDQS